MPTPSITLTGTQVILLQQLFTRHKGRLQWEQITCHALPSVVNLMDAGYIQRHPTQMGVGYTPGHALPVCAPSTQGTNPGATRHV